MLGLLIGVCAVLGLAVGSFLNVVIYRVPRGESIVSPRSSCPSCGTPIRERDNIPVVSWLLLRGRCRHCQAPISMRYPLVELACAALFAGTAARFGYQWDLPAYLALFAGLLALSCIDVERMILPKKIVYPLTTPGGGLVAPGGGRDGQVARLRDRGHLRGRVVHRVLRTESCQSAALGFRGRTAFLGARPLAGLAGRGYVLLGFFAANLIGAVVGIALIATKRMERQSRIPYGVFLASGCALAVFAGPEILRPFTHYSI